jgi:RHS repeat-associated protein
VAASGAPAPGRPLDFALPAPLSSSVPVNRFSYTYDAAGRRTLALAALGVRTSYAYDAAGQLVREWRGAGPLPADATFSYDPAGNRTLLLDSGQRTTSVYDAANQQLLDLSAAGRTTYGYDPAGNRTRREGPSAVTYYAWDAHNRLTQAEPVGGPVTYAYDGDGRRTRRQTPTEARRYVYDFEKVLQDTDDAGLTQRQYASTEEQYGELLSAYGGGQARYFAPDGLGSTDALLAPDGSVPDRWAYRAFGLESHTLGGDDNRFTWVGSQGYYDDREAGLYFLRARYYDPAAARFASPDPEGFAAGDANLYRYAFNDPVNHTDPSGRRLLVPKCGLKLFQARVESGDYITQQYSDPADALGGEIQSAYDVRPYLPRFGPHVPIRGEDVTIGPNTYRQVDLYDSLPANFWGQVRYGPAPDKGPPALRDALLMSLDQDFVVRFRSEWWSDKSLEWTPPGTAPEGTGWVGAIVQAGGDAFSVVKEALETQAGRALLAGLAAALRRAKGQFGDLDPDALIDLVNRLGRVGEVAAKAAQEPQRLGKTLGCGVELGFKQYFNPDKLFQNVIKAFLDWLLMPLEDEGYELPDLPDNLDYSKPEALTTLAGFALGVLGLTPEAVLETSRRVALQKVGGGPAAGLLLAAYELIAVAAEGGLPAVADLLGNKAAGLAANAGLGADLQKVVQAFAAGDPIPLEDLKQQAYKAAWEAAQKEFWSRLVEFAFKQLAKLADVTGISAVVDGLYAAYKAVAFILKEVKNLVKFLETLAQGVEALLRDDIGAVAATVEKGIGKVVVFLLRYLLNVVLMLSGLPTRVADAIKTVKSWVQAQLERVLGWLLEKGKVLLGLGDGSGEGGRLTPKVQKPGGGVQVWLKAGPDGKAVLMAHASPDEPLGEKLQEWEKKLPPEKKGLAAQLKSLKGTSEAAGTRLGARVLTDKAKLMGKQALQGARKEQADATQPLVKVSELAGLVRDAVEGCPRGACLEGIAPLHKVWGVGPMQEARTGMGVVGATGERSDPAGLRLLRLSLDYGGGDGVELELLRPAGWQGAVPGGVAWVDLPEMGTVGWARVESVGPCPPLDPEGALVTGVFRHRRGRLWDLRVEGEERPLGVTGAHPLWSVDRGMWVAAAELEVGERLLGLRGPARLLGRTLRPDVEPVYNIEVDGDHCYRVGRQGLLVHNASVNREFWPHMDGESDEKRTCINIHNVARYDDKPPVLQIAAGTQVYRGALTLDTKAYSGKTAVMVLTTETYNQMPWFKSVLFDKIVVINPLNEPARNADYSWLFENARYVLKKGGTLELTGSRVDQEALNYLRDRNNLTKTLALGYDVGFKPIPADIEKLFVKTTDPNVLELASEWL